MRISPRPKIISVHPALGSNEGGTLLTVNGAYLAPETCRAGSVCSGVSVRIGGKACPIEGAVSQEQITCRTPSGLGRHDLVLEVIETFAIRSAKQADAFVQHDILFAGLTTEPNVRHSEFGGYVAYAFGGGDGKRQTSSVIFENFHPLSAKGVRAVAMYKSKTYIAGGFTQGLSNHIAAFDGTAVFDLGSGVDGLVNVLIPFNDLLVVGGVFTKVIKQPSKRLAWFNTGVLRTGGLATWDGNSWGRLGSKPFVGVVTSLHVNGSVIYAGGRFNEENRKNNLAMYNGTSWSSVCGLDDNCGVTGGEVFAMATLGEDLYVGGSFVRAGGVSAPRIARWDGLEWFAMSGLDGDVHALAILKDSVYVGGSFGGGKDSAISYLAQWRQGSWQAVQGGVDGPVFTLVGLDSCLYIGGSFGAAGGQHEISGVRVQNAARWCFDQRGRSDSSWSAVQWPPSTANIGTCRCIALA
jgi:hypothetical protein